MQLTTLSLLLLALSLVMFQAGRERSLQTVGGPGNASRLHSRPQYHGYFVAIRSLGPALLIVLLWLMFESRIVIGLALSGISDAWTDLPRGQFELLINSVRNLAAGNAIVGQADENLQLAAERFLSYTTRSRNLLAATAILCAVLSGALAWKRISPGFRARNRVESVLNNLLIAASSIALFTTIGIVLSVVFEAVRFFGKVPVSEFLFGLEWSPQTSIRAEQVGASGSFGAVPLFVGTLLITVVAMLVAVPIGLFTAVYLSEYATSRMREIAKPLLEILAGIPTVVYGFFAAVTVAPFLRRVGIGLGLDVSSESALAAGLVMGVMIIPLISSLSDDALRAVPTATREGALALGSTRSEMMTRVIMPAALPGIAGGVLLAFSRAIGETMIVVMAAGLAANLTFNPFEAVTTVTVQIVSLLVGDQEFDSAKTLAAFALGLVLFLVTLVLNVFGLRVVRRYREQYE
jgi:phosphate transport system permease protein